MMCAAMNGHISVVTYLCENGADVNIQEEVSNYIIVANMITYLIIIFY
jgi:ankyrin repeat protein